MELVVPAAAAAKSPQSCPTLCDPIDGGPPGCPVPGILQARTLEWVAISFSSAWKWKVKVKSLSRVWLLAAPWTAAYQAPPSMRFSRQEYCSGVPLPSYVPANMSWLLPQSRHSDPDSCGHMPWAGGGPGCWWFLRTFAEAWETLLGLPDPEHILSWWSGPTPTPTLPLKVVSYFPPTFYFILS